MIIFSICIPTRANKWPWWALYDDIINLPHPTSAKHPRMPLSDRAAQFAPFAALVGYDAVVSETGRLTEAKRLLSEDALALLDRKQQRLATCLDQRPQVTVTYFRHDPRKAGGAYITITGHLKRLDASLGVLQLTDGHSIPLEDVCALESPLLPNE